MCGSRVAGSDRTGGAVTLTTANDARPATRTSPGNPPGPPDPAAGADSTFAVRAVSPTWVSGRRRPHGVRAGQIVTAQVAVALPLAALGRGAGALAGALLAAAVLLPLAWVRVRGRWLFEWAGLGLGYLTRRRVLPAGAGPAALLDLVAPGVVVRPAGLAGAPGAVLDDPAGLVALLEIAEPGELLGDGPRPLPSPTALLPPATTAGPPVRIQLLLAHTSAPAPTSGATAGTSYRQLTDGRLAGREQVVLAVRVLRVDGWSAAEARQALTGTVRRIVRRLGRLNARPLGADAVRRVLSELAHHDGTPLRECWSAVRGGDLSQTTFRLTRWPDLHGDGGRRLVSRLLALPATASTVSLSAGPPSASAELTVRLTARSSAELALATQALHRLVTTLGAEACRLDGDQLAGLTASLPLAPPEGPGQPAAALDGLELVVGDAGLMLGTNRHGAAVTVRLFRPDATRVLLVGGVPAAQLVAVRAMALGARVLVQTTRPQVWEPFVRGVGAPGTTIPLLPPGRPLPEGPPTPLSPTLIVVDVGPVAVEPEPGPPWQSTLVVRDQLTPADVDALSRADLAVLQPLDPGEAALAGAALGLGESAEWLTRIRDDMVAVVNRRALRWALLATTPIESQLIGRPSRR
ncbi:type VII secretion protein EccE [Micromonospora sp. NPDC049366]|uniref:type VII secretion protein EccE n=1 Tax=Micromonospora sp. NPDC049366 TaxID=3364271 RepID=UPI0037B9ABF7